MSVSTLEKKIQSEYGSTIQLFEVEKNTFDIITPIRFSDGDHISITLKKEDGRWILTDEGNTYMHLSLMMDVDSLFEGSRWKLLSSILLSNQIEDREGELITAVGKDYGQALTNFSQAIMKIAGIEYLSKERVKKTFKEDFEEAISEILPESRVKFNWFDKDRDEKGTYKVDCRVNHMKKPLFIYALPTEKKVNEATIATYEFQKWGIDFTPVAIFDNKEEIGKKAQSRLTRVCPNQFSNLKENKSYIQKKIKELAKV